MKATLRTSHCWRSMTLPHNIRASGTALLCNSLCGEHFRCRISAIKVSNVIGMQQPITGRVLNHQHFSTQRESVKWLHPRQPQAEIVTCMRARHSQRYDRSKHAKVSRPVYIMVRASIPIYCPSVLITY